MEKVIKKQGFHRWAWLVVFLLGRGYRWSMAGRRI